MDTILNSLSGTSKDIGEVGLTKKTAKSGVFSKLMESLQKHLNQADGMVKVQGSKATQKVPLVTAGDAVGKAKSDIQAKNMQTVPVSGQLLTPVKHKGTLLASNETTLVTPLVLSDTPTSALLNKGVIGKGVVDQVVASKLDVKALGSEKKLLPEVAEASLKGKKEAVVKEMVAPQVAAETAQPLVDVAQKDVVTDSAVPVATVVSVEAVAQATVKTAAAPQVAAEMKVEGKSVAQATVKEVASPQVAAETKVEGKAVAQATVKEVAASQVTAETKVEGKAVAQASVKEVAAPQVTAESKVEGKAVAQASVKAAAAPQVTAETKVEGKAVAQASVKEVAAPQVTAETKVEGKTVAQAHTHSLGKTNAEVTAPVQASPLVAVEGAQSQPVVQKAIENVFAGAKSSALFQNEGEDGVASDASKEKVSKNTLISGDVVGKAGSAGQTLATNRVLSSGVTSHAPVALGSNSVGGVSTTLSGESTSDSKDDRGGSTRSAMSLVDAMSMRDLRSTQNNFAMHMAYRTAQGFQPHDAMYEISKAAKDGMRKLELQLEPASLGKIQVTLQMDAAKQIQVHMLVDQSASRQILEQQMPQLRQALADQGLNLSGFTMDTNSQQGQGGSGANQGFARQGSPQGTANRFDEPMAHTINMGVNTASHGRLNILA